MLPPQAQKDRTTHPQRSTIADAPVVPPDGSQSCVNMELASNSDEDDSVTYIVLDEVHGDFSDHSDSPALPKVLSPPHDGPHTGESIQRESKVVRETEVKEVKVETLSVTDKTASQKPRRKVRQMDLLHVQ